jgi:hypothetical protein
VWQQTEEFVPYLNFSQEYIQTMFWNVVYLNDISDMDTVKYNTDVMPVTYL